nr:helix-turn-helix domain-containing protein [Acinetobacter baumannii]
SLGVKRCFILPILLYSRRTVDRNVVLTLHQKGTGATEIAHQLSIARSTVYKILEDERAS